VGQDKDSLIEQQRKPAVTTILITIIYKTNGIHSATRCDAQRAPEPRFTSSVQFPHSAPSRTARGWVSWPSCVLSWLLGKINPILAKPRTNN